MKAAFNTLRDHARGRNIEFSISFECFRKFALRCRYLKNRGRDGESITVDRIDNLKGYVPGNIQPMSRSKNSEKKMKQDQRRYEYGYGWTNKP